MNDPTRRPGAPLTHAEQSAVGTAALHRFRANLTPDKMCGAKARSTGEPCRQIPAKGRKRCKFHGGATPKGGGALGWHTRATPTDDPRSARIKAARRAKQRARVEAMTPEERAAYDEWHRTHRPGSAAARAQGRQNRASREWLAGLMADAPAPPTPERVRLAEARVKLRAELARLEAPAADPPPIVDEFTGGLFD